jgi:hypothetical protein
MIRPRTERPWRNIAPPAPLPPPSPDKWQWVPGEIVLGPTPSAPTLPPTEPAPAGQEPTS